jgi:hypothetical protein
VALGRIRSSWSCRHSIISQDGSPTPFDLTLLSLRLATPSISCSQVLLRGTNGQAVAAVRISRNPLHASSSPSTASSRTFPTTATVLRAGKSSPRRPRCQDCLFLHPQLHRGFPLRPPRPSRPARCQPLLPGCCCRCCSAALPGSRC